MYKKSLYNLFNNSIKCVDIYHHNGSTWLIFTDSKKWVLELTKVGTLWYNVHFFQDCFKYLSLDVTENQHYIKEWVEDTIQNGVIHTERRRFRDPQAVEDTIQNGVKHIRGSQRDRQLGVRNITQNGVKHTHGIGNPIWVGKKVEDTIQNGIKEIIGEHHDYPNTISNIIKDGIKQTGSEINITEGGIDNIIQDEIKVL
jgi:hypothetical protein